MECKGCKKQITEDQSKQVGKWHFCNTCFEDLLAQPSKPAAESDTQEEPKDTAEEPALFVLKGEQARCTVCDTVLEDGAGRDMGILTVCEDCYQEMIARPEPIKIKVEEPVDEPEPEEDETPLPDPMETVPCAECKRTIRKIAAKIHDEALYCPDCFYKNNYQNEDG
ncbi:MAG: hypothetical protein MI892_24945 [Desulfobacterales bacterium]|nr:hypothetical protein [Desulfobacterales bacterium]